MVPENDREEILTVRRDPYRKEREAAAGRLPFYAQKFPEAAEILYFYGRLLECQGAIETPDVRTLGDCRGPRMAPAIRSVLDTCRRYGTDILRQEAGELEGLTDADLGGMAEAFFQHALEGTSRLAVMAALGATATILAIPLASRPHSVCPACGMPPVVSYLAEDNDSQGIRFAHCGVCHAEWPVARTACLSCGKEDDGKLAYFHAEGNREVMIQLCRECGRYTKIIDFRERGPVTPEMEDIATLSLDLWMQGQGHRKLFPNLFGY
jgi:FdhE protein